MVKAFKIVIYNFVGLHFVSSSSSILSMEKDSPWTVRPVHTARITTGSRRLMRVKSREGSDLGRTGPTKWVNQALADR